MASWDHRSRYNNKEIETLACSPGESVGCARSLSNVFPANKGYPLQLGAAFDLLYTRPVLYHMYGCPDHSGVNANYSTYRGFMYICRDGGSVSFENYTVFQEVAVLLLFMPWIPHDDVCRFDGHSQQGNQGMDSSGTHVISQS